MRYFLGVTTIILMGFYGSLVLAQSTNGVVIPGVNTPISQTQDIQTLSKRWKISEQEYEQYLDLMSGPLGKWSPDLDPLLVLGMFAETAQKERRYAELYAQQEFDFTERTLKFQQVYREAFDRLYSGIAISDPQLLAPYFQHEQQKSLAQDAKQATQKYFEVGDRLLLFAPNDCPKCRDVISHLSSLLVYQYDTGIDVYVLDAQSDDDVRQWVDHHHIDTDWLEEQRLTLNRDEGLLQRLHSQSTVSYNDFLPVFLHRDGQFFQLNRESLAL